MEPLQLDWSTAGVSDGTLTVDLTDKPPKEWRNTFERTAALLGARSWPVTLNSKKGSVKVASVQPGDEERVRQLLEGAVLEANSTLVSEQALFDGQPADDDEQEHGPESGSESDAPEASRDEELTGRFREFAREQGDGND